MIEHWNDRLYRTLAWAHLDWKGFSRAAMRAYGVFVRVSYTESLYCRHEEDFEELARECPFILTKPCDCEKARVVLTAWEAFLEHTIDSTRFLKWCEAEKAATFDWGFEDAAGKPCGSACNTDPDVLWRFDVDGVRYFRIRRVQPLIYVDAAAFTLVRDEPRFADLARRYREDRHARAGLAAQKTGKAT